MASFVALIEDYINVNFIFFWHLEVLQIYVQMLYILEYNTPLPSSKLLLLPPDLD